MTGLSTDLGLNLIRFFFPNQPGPRFKEERIVTVTRVLTLGALRLFVIVAIIAVIGIWSGLKLPISLYPQTSKPVVQMGMSYAGYSPMRYSKTPPLWQPHVMVKEVSLAFLGAPKKFLDTL